MSHVKKVLQQMKNDEQIIADAIKTPRMIPDDTHKIIVYPLTMLGYSRNSIRLKKVLRTTLPDEIISALDDELEYHNIDDENIIAIIIDAFEEMQAYREYKLDLDRDHYNRTKKRLEDNAREIVQYGGNAEVILPAYPMEVLNGLAIDISRDISKEAFLSIIRLSGIYTKDAGRKAREKRNEELFKEHEAIYENTNDKEKIQINYSKDVLEFIKNIHADLSIILEVNNFEMNNIDEVVRISIIQE